ncbi:unnamed protein product [Staurois parvus]|uniref:Uncharacterized protein n=1 Tax=Staurois parvus TaxID=386267 RepID=A0ABN9FHV8_9NEOB|nr:unnamed protein product [Staurois parvus]
MKKYRGCNIVSICIHFGYRCFYLDTNRYNVATSILFNVKYNSAALCRDRSNYFAIIFAGRRRGENRPIFFTVGGKVGQLNNRFFFFFF